LNLTQCGFLKLFRTVAYSQQIHSLPAKSFIRNEPFSMIPQIATPYFVTHLGK